MKRESKHHSEEAGTELGVRAGPVAQAAGCGSGNRRPVPCSCLLLPVASKVVTVRILLSDTSPYPTSCGAVGTLELTCVRTLIFSG